jgi:hypothetical protein
MTTQPSFEVSGPTEESQPLPAKAPAMSLKTQIDTLIAGARKS